jgi:hypothetical protein
VKIREIEDMSNLGGIHGIYSPIPQAITDSESDSEEQLHVSAKNERKQEVTMTNGRSPFLNSPEGEDLEESGLDIDSRTESVGILQPDKSAERMSPLRKFLFVLSIVVCFLTVIVFLWVLPCSVSSGAENKKTGWENPYHDIEIKGAINIVNGAPNFSKNLIMLYRGDVIDLERPRENGIISIVSVAGKVGWFVRLP